MIVGGRGTSTLPARRRLNANHVDLRTRVGSINLSANKDKTVIGDFTGVWLSRVIIRSDGGLISLVDAGGNGGAGKANLGSPRVTGSIHALSACINLGSIWHSCLRPPPGRRVRLASATR